MRVTRIVEQSDILFAPPVEVDGEIIGQVAPMVFFNIMDDDSKPKYKLAVFLCDYSCPTHHPNGFTDQTVPPHWAINSLVEFGFKPGAELVETVVRVNGMPTLVGFALTSVLLDETIAIEEISATAEEYDDEDEEDDEDEYADIT